MYVIGTAGHVDHGKSTLVRALTGTDPDRLREEKERGLTIELGFAQLQLPSGDEVSIVDVPGHERFIKNMLAGVGGIDLALLVVAADEGVMPQTREHLAIIDLLGIEHGVVALTKTDVAEPELLDVAESDVGKALAGTTLADAPIVRCSGATREGLDALVAAIAEQLALTPRKRDLGRPRLSVDRAFTMTGFGTVVTGTLIDGSLRAGDEVVLLPDGLRARVRGLQNHNHQVETALPGTRTAINLSGVTVEELRRGMVVALPGKLGTTKAVDVQLRAVPYLGRVVKHNLAVTFHTGATEADGRLILLDADELRPGETGWAQVRLKAPIAVVRGDRLVVRDPNDTLGGGSIVDVDANRHRRHDPVIIAALERLAKGSPEDLLLEAVARAEPVRIEDAAAAAAITPHDAIALVDGLIESGALVRLGDGMLITAGGLDALAGRSRDSLSAYHRDHPLRRGMPREELRMRLTLKPPAFDGVASQLTEAGTIVAHGAVLALPGHEPALDPTQAAAAASYVESLRAAPFSPPEGAPPPEVLLLLEERGDIVRVGDGIVFDAATYAEITSRIVERLRESGTITLAELRDLLGASRKYAQALLEHLDAKRVTRRVGDERVLR